MATATNTTLSQTQLKQAITDFMAGRDTGYLGTGGKELRVSPVKYFVDQDLNIYIHSKGGGKFDNLRHDEEVCMLVCTPFEDDFQKIKGVQVFGRAAVGDTGSALYEQAEELCPWDHPDDVQVIKIDTEQIVYVDRLSQTHIKQTWNA